MEALRLTFLVGGVTAAILVMVRLTRSLDLTKPIGLFVLRLLVPAGIALALFLWAGHIAQDIAPRVQFEEMMGSYGRPDNSLKVQQLFIFVLRTAGWLVIGVALLRLYQLYRRLEAGQITLASTWQQIQSKTTPATSTAPALTAVETEKNLAALKRMKDEGMMTETEYDEKRKEILSRM